MPAETLSGGGEITADDVRSALRDALEEVAVTDRDARIEDQTRLDEIGLEGVVLLDVAELVAADLGERQIVGFDGSELDECETIGDLLWLLERCFVGADQVSALRPTASVAPKGRADVD